MQSDRLLEFVCLIQNARHRNFIAVDTDGSLVSGTMSNYDEAPEKSNIMMGRYITIGPTAPKMGDAVIARDREQLLEIKECATKGLYVIYREMYPELLLGLRSKEVGTHVTLQHVQTNSSNQWEVIPWTGGTVELPSQLPTVKVLRGSIDNGRLAQPEANHSACSYVISLLLSFAALLLFSRA
ncbi:hypothetical protein BD410DRAFT_809587 [Rickenella mellea]|uniref:Uncharacterized protein n=1 Tax=Rickenella mellea TaxID=50990 RepID=A0A4Y7PJB7_9AGAM|nr:hypothetical protein BD410DRAFT_809587 [Rickenella mellea]